VNIVYIHTRRLAKSFHSLHHFGIFLLCVGQTSGAHNSSSTSTRPRCHPMFGYLFDRSSRKNVSICSDRPGIHNERVEPDENLIYVSQSNQLQLVTMEDVAYKSIIRLAGNFYHDYRCCYRDQFWHWFLPCYTTHAVWLLNCFVTDSCRLFWSGAAVGSRLVETSRWSDHNRLLHVTSVVAVELRQRRLDGNSRRLQRARWTKWVRA
jgi:hypothetical protein